MKYITPVFYAETGIPKLHATVCKCCEGPVQNPASYLGYCSFECLQLTKRNRDLIEAAKGYPELRDLAKGAERSL